MGLRGGGMEAVRGLFVGLVTVDIQYLLEAPPDPDGKTPARDLAVATGGPAANAAVTFAHLGGQARLLTRLGDHPFSGFMRDDLHRYGVDVIDFMPDSTSLPTISAVMSVPGTGHRSIVTYWPRDMRAVDTPVVSAALDGVDIVLVDGFYMDVAIAVASAARRRGIPVVIDAGTWHAGMDRLLAEVDVAICAETFRPPGAATPADVFAALAQFGVRERAITGGGGAIRYARDGGTAEIPVAAIEAVDTSGAGDVLHGAYCYHHARGDGFALALEHAARVATRSCQYFGTRAWMAHDAPDA